MPLIEDAVQLLKDDYLQIAQRFPEEVTPAVHRIHLAAVELLRNVGDNPNGQAVYYERIAYELDKAYDSAKDALVRVEQLRLKKLRGMPDVPILLCPACGSESSPKLLGARAPFAVSCVDPDRECGLTGPYGSDPGDAIEKWNLLAGYRIREQLREQHTRAIVHFDEAVPLCDLSDP